MNEQAIRHALSLANTSFVSDATKIPPHVLERIVDGAVPTPEEIDLIYGYFRGEFFLSSTGNGWQRSTRKVETLPLPLACETVAGPKYPFPHEPILKAGPKPTGTGAAASAEGFTGTGVRVK